MPIYNLIQEINLFAVTEPFMWTWFVVVTVLALDGLFGAIGCLLNGEK